MTELDKMNPAQRSSYRRTQLALAIYTLIYEDFLDLSNSEIQAVFVEALSYSIHRNMRPKRRVIGRAEEE